MSDGLGFDRAPVEINLKFDIKQLPGKYGIRLKNADGEKLTLLYDKNLSQFIMDRTQATNAKFHDRFGSVQKAGYKVESSSMGWQLLIDVASVELFADHGKIVFTDTFYPTKPFDQIEILSENGSVVLKSGTVRQLKSIHPLSM